MDCGEYTKERRNEIGQSIREHFTKYEATESTLLDLLAHIDGAVPLGNDGIPFKAWQDLASYGLLTLAAEMSGMVLVDMPKEEK